MSEYLSNDHDVLLDDNSTDSRHNPVDDKSASSAKSRNYIAATNMDPEGSPAELSRLVPRGQLQRGRAFQDELKEESSEPQNALYATSDEMFNRKNF